MRRNGVLLCVVTCLLLCSTRVPCTKKERKWLNKKPLSVHRQKKNNATKKSSIEKPLYFHRNYANVCPCREVSQKKSIIYRGANYEAVEKHKRGFLANLASLLNDAERMATRKSEDGLTAINQKQPPVTLNQVEEKNERSPGVLTTVRKKSLSMSTVNNNLTVTPDANVKNIVNTDESNSSKTAIGTPANAHENTKMDTINKTPTTPPMTSTEQRPPLASRKHPVMKKGDIRTAIPLEMLSLLNNSDIDFAPIFAMYRGKVIPLGKLPETAFTKRFITPGSFAIRGGIGTPEQNYTPRDTLLNDDPEPPPPFRRDVTGTKRTIFNMPKDVQGEHNHMVSKLQEKKDLNKLALYLQSLDDHMSSSYPTKETMDSDKDIRGVTKDEVVFPGMEEGGSPRADIFTHVKGVVLDNGRILTVKHNGRTTATKETIDTPPSDTPQKFIVTEDGTLAPFVKQKAETVHAVTRDTGDIPDPPPSPHPPAPPPSPTSIPDSQKTVSLTLDVLKELLKKTDTKITLESLLNKSPDRKSESADRKSESADRKSDSPSHVQETEDSDSDKKGDSNVSLAALLNKKPEVKSEAPKETEEDDPGTIEDFAAGGLKAHNDYRVKHHDEPLVWSDDIASKAQKLAESLADKKTLEIAKDLEKEGYGENVAKVWATFKNAGEAAAKMWYTQSDNYHFDDPHLDENTGQFAQVVWKSTKELGMGVAKSIDDVNNKYVYVTALYRPPGNVESILRENVLPTGNNTVDVYTTFFKREKVIPSGRKRTKKENIEKGVDFTDLKDALAGETEKLVESNDFDEKG